MKLGLLGCGHLGTAFATGVIGKGLLPAANVCVCDTSAERRSWVEQELGVRTFSEVNAMIPEVDVLILAVKPNIFPEIAPALDKTLLRGKTVMTFMAGKTIADVQALLGVDCQLIRVMQNIAVANAESLTAICDNGFDRTYWQPIKDIYAQLGCVIEVAEADIDKITALSGSGLGFFSYIIASFIKAGERLGFDAKTAEAIVEQTFKGSLSLGDYAEMAKKVATKGGTTEQGLNVLITHNMDEIAHETVDAAYQKALALKN